MKASDFEPGCRVRYIPHHALLDAKRNNTDATDHPDCENGIVRGFGRLGSVFVVYDNAIRGMMTTLKKAERWTAAATNPDDLVKI